MFKWRPVLYFISYMFHQWSRYDNVVALFKVQLSSLHERTGKTVCWLIIQATCSSSSSSSNMAPTQCWVISCRELQVTWRESRADLNVDKQIKTSDVVHAHPPCALWCLSLLPSPCKRSVHLASGVSSTAAWCLMLSWRTLNAAAADALHNRMLIVARCYGQIAVVYTYSTVYRLCSAIIYNHFNKLSLINQCSFNIPVWYCILSLLLISL